MRTSRCACRLGRSTSFRGVKYDADVVPDARLWLRTADLDRMKAAEESHEPIPEGHPPIRLSRIHAAVHVTIETQLAEGRPAELIEAYRRLTAGGLTRHDVIHALGSAASDLVYAAIQGQPYDASQYAAKLRALDPQEWKRKRLDKV